ncbi:MAG: chemotaxis protein CheA [Nitrospirae bacterium]|nr:chemotaxis protein CheA [Nitrospirota bacterium]
MNDSQKDSQFREMFREEAGEHLVDLENALIELEERPDDADLINRAFRAMHTIKGCGAMFGFDDVSRFTHDIETVFMLVRDGELGLTKDLVSLTLRAKDEIKSMLDPSMVPGGADLYGRVELTKAFSAIAHKKTGGEMRSGMDSGSSRIFGDSGEFGKAGGTQSSQSAAIERTYRIRFRPPSEIFLHGINPILLIKELAGFGRARVVAHTGDIPSLDQLNPEECFVFWDVVLTTDAGEDKIREVFLFVEDDSELKVELIDEPNSPDANAGYKKLGEILVGRGDITESELDGILSAGKRIGEILVEKGVVRPGCVEAALAEQQHIRDIRKSRVQEEALTTIRVPAEKLDTLVNLVGELVTLQARLSRTAIKRIDYELLGLAEEVERLVSELRDNTMNMRMLPIGTVYNKFNRLVRDLSSELNKEIEFITEGAATELDKTVIEKLNDPLIHIIRNSIDHGIELPSVRQEKGKPRKGTLLISAAHSGAHVVISISDDGAGLNKEVIRAKAIEKKLIHPSAELSENELFSIIFAPGFSTAKEVTSVSGRGVGMDVVKRAIESLKGSIDITSEDGIRTTITIKLPLTLAIIDGLLVKIGKDQYVLPLATVVECIALTKQEIGRTHHGELVVVRGDLIPYINLRRHFFINGQAPDLQQVVVTDVSGKRVGFLVDKVIGQYQTVIKKLGGIYKDVVGMSGATILGDGTVAVILDVPKLIGLVEKEHDALFGGQSSEDHRTTIGQLC